ncbi:YciI family protein [Neobacillus cucumis]|uniref:YciI family protein n=1 Tax=Neobacillus cucumis TaxID=1740721 RepID=UPI002E213D70|nr:YciI family protein [Neobacillus cucumis]
MKYFAVISRMLDVDKNNSLRDEHLNYLKKLGKEGKVFSKGRFTDGTGGLVIYKADSQEVVKNMVECDPFVSEGARSYEIHEWVMQLINNE